MWIRQAWKRTSLAQGLDQSRISRRGEGRGYSVRPIQKANYRSPKMSQACPRIFSRRLYLLCFETAVSSRSSFYSFKLRYGTYTYVYWLLVWASLCWCGYTCLVVPLKAHVTPWFFTCPMLNSKTVCMVNIYINLNLSMTDEKSVITRTWTRDPAFTTFSHCLSWWWKWLPYLDFKVESFYSHFCSDVLGPHHFNRDSSIAWAYYYFRIVLVFPGSPVRLHLHTQAQARM